MARFGMPDNTIYFVEKERTESRSEKALRVIERTNNEAQPIPKDALSAEDAKSAVKADLRALKRIDEAEWTRAHIAIGHTASKQKAYLAELQRQSPDVAKVAMSEFAKDREEWKNLPGVQVAGTREQASLPAQEPNAAKGDRIASAAENLAFPKPAKAAPEPRDRIAEAAERTAFGQPPPESESAPDKRRAIPESVAARYLKVEDKFYSHDKKLAFVDSGTKLKAETNSIDVVRSIVEIAEARGWDAISITGTKDFRRQVWREAAMRGIEAKGYEASEIERAEVKATLEKRHGPNAIEQEARSPTATREPSARAPEDRQVPRGAESWAKAPGKAPPAPNLIGTEQQQTRAQPTPVQPAAPKVWPVPNHIGIESRGATLKRLAQQEAENERLRAALDARLDEIGKNLEGAVAMAGIAEQLDKSPQRTASADAVHAGTNLVATHPDSPAFVASVRAAELLAAERIGEPAEQQRFVSAVRQVLTEKQARKEPIPAPKIKESAHQRWSDKTPQVQAQEQEYVRA